MLAHLHPGTVVFSTVLAIVCDDILKGSGLNVTTKQFFEAVVGAYEVAIVLGKMLNPDHRNKGFHSTGTIGTIAAAACASKLLDLNLEDTINCLGLATTQSAGLLEADHAGTCFQHFSLRMVLPVESPSLMVKRVSLKQ